MENSSDSSQLSHPMKIFLKNSVLQLNVTLWFFALCFSIHDDEIAAFLSYVSVTLTILTVKYYLSEEINNNPAAYFIDCSSKLLVLAGIFLVLLPQFWNTAFYSICLGIIIQTLNHKELKKPETVSDYEKIATSSSKENNIGNWQVSKNENSLHDHHSESRTISMEADESILKCMEYLTESNVVSNYEDAEEIKSTEKLCTLQVQLLNLQELESSECSKLESKFELNENNIERELKRNEACVNIPIKRMAFNKTDADFSKEDTKQSDNADSSMDFISEPKKTVNNSVSFEQVDTTSDVHMDNFETFIENDLITSYSSKNSLPMNPSESKIDVETVNLKLVIKDNENLLAPNSESPMLDSNFQHKENSEKVSSHKIDTDSQREISTENNTNLNPEVKYERMKTKYASTSAKGLNIQPENGKSSYQINCTPEKCNNEATNFNASLQYKERMGEVLSTELEISREKNLTNETNLQEHSFESDENLNTEVRYSNMNCTSVKTTDIKQEYDISQMKLIFQQINDGNLETVLGKKDKILLENPFEPKCLNNCSTIIDDNSSKLNESADVEEKTVSNESVKKTLGDEKTTLFPNISNVDDVVNRIDLSFIYALGFNIPSAQ